MIARRQQRETVRTHYVLIDFESVQPSSIAALEQECFKVIIFVGEKQVKVSFDFAASVQRLGERARYVRMTGAGPNALDFHIAFYIGELSAAEPGAHFHIVSKDTGFDPLIAHLKSRKISAARAKDLAGLPKVKILEGATPADRHALILADLRQRGSCKPGTVKTLTSTINALFQKSLSDGEIASLLDGLKEQGIISVAGSKVSYVLPE